MPKLSIELVSGNLVNVKADAYALGVFEDVAPKMAFATVDRVLGGKIRELYRAGALDGRLGRITEIEAADKNLLANRIIFVGLGTIDNERRQARDLSEVGRALGKYFAATNGSEIATVPLGLGSGVSAREVTRYYFSGIFEVISDNSASDYQMALKICDLSRFNCEALAAELRQLRAPDVLGKFDWAITEADAPAEPMAAHSSKIEMPEDVSRLIIAMGDDLEATQETIDVEALFLRPLAPAGICSVRQTIERPKLRAMIAAFDSQTPIGLRRGLDLATYVLGEDLIGELAAAHILGSSLILTHDAASSIVPWEAMSFPELAYPATRMSMSRQFRMTGANRKLAAPAPADSLRVLLVSDPTGDLPNAAREGREVELALLGHADVTALEYDTATRENIIGALRSKPFDVMHYAGHAFFDPENRGASGLVCHGGEVITGSDLAALERLPRMLIFNACESGMMRRGEHGRDMVEATAQNRIERNVGLAEAAICSGVYHFLGTYWPVGDAAGAAFASSLYRYVTDGCTVGEAVMRGRQQVMKVSAVDWANYIHYGDPTDRLVFRQ